MASSKIYHHETDHTRVVRVFLKGAHFKMMDDEVALLLSNFRITPCLPARLPTQVENCIVNGEEGWMGVFETSFSHEFNLPLHYFGLQFLRCSSLAPSQLHPNGCAELVDFFVHCREKELVPLVDFLYCFFHLHLVKKHYRLYTFQCTSVEDSLFYDSSPKVDSFDS